MYRILYVPTGEFLPIAEFNNGKGTHYFEYTNVVTEGFVDRYFAESVISQILEVLERVTTENHPDFMPNEDGTFLMTYCEPIFTHLGKLDVGDMLPRSAFEVVKF